MVSYIIYRFPLRRRLIKYVMHTITNMSLIFHIFINKDIIYLIILNKLLTRVEITKIPYKIN